MNKALILIDIQKGFMNKMTSSIPSKIKRFIKKNSNKYNLILFTQYLNYKNSNLVKYLDWDGFMDKSETDIVDELQEFITSNNLFKKHTYSSFVDNKLLNTLKRNKIKQVDVGGIETENCVLTFARDAFDRGFKVRVFKDLSASHSDQKLHKVALDIIDNNIGEVV